jgi:hypothetical protein
MLDALMLKQVAQIEGPAKHVMSMHAEDDQGGMLS